MQCHILVVYFHECGLQVQSYRLPLCISNLVLNSHILWLSNKSMSQTIITPVKTCQERRIYVRLSLKDQETGGFIGSNKSSSNIYRV
ncbi:hypothetical protein AHAS_Ahas05G0163500 [Arachis hypogaea]